MANPKKVTINQIDKLIVRANKNAAKWDTYLVYLIDLKAKLTEAIHDGKTPPTKLKPPPLTK